MVLKRLKLHEFLMVWHDLIPTHKCGCRKEREFENFSKKRCFLSFEW